MEPSKKKMVFIVESISQPRIIKRIESFINAGYEVDIYGFDRGIHKENAKISGAEIKTVDKLEDGKNYFGKLIKVYKLHRQINKDYTSNDIFYFFGILNALFSLLFSYKYIYEVSDILYEYKRFRFIAPFLKKLEKKIIRRSLLTVMTSGGFVNYFFGNQQPSNVIVQPNKLHPSFHYTDRQNFRGITSSEKIVFGFVGAFRYPNTIFRFAHVIGKRFPNHSFKFFGDSSMTPEVKAIAAQYKNVFYEGAFKNPEDLENIYKSLDFVIACYEISGRNERMAEPNKMYEAIFFKKPILVSKSTYLEKQVMKTGVGFAIDATEEKNIIEFINSLTDRKLLEVQKKINEIDTLALIDDDSKKIIEFLTIKFRN